MAVIQVRYIPCTNTKGSRLKAFAAGQSVTVGFHFASCDMHEKCRIVAMNLAEKLNWNDEYYGTWHGGQLQNGDFVFVSGN